MGVGKLLLAGIAALSVKAIVDEIAEEERKRKNREAFEYYLENASALPGGSVARQPEPKSHPLAAANTLQDIYEILTIEGNEIRVLAIEAGAYDSPIRCSLTVGDLRNVEYEALSYTWGDPAGVKPIKIEGVDCKITKNLDTALRYLRPRTGMPRVLWVDALCVNQGSEKEKNIQVPRMGTIYNFAKKVLVWLGPEDKKSTDAMKYFNRLGNGYPSMRQLEDSYTSNQEIWLDFGDNLLTVDWWGRAWIVQELTMACESEFIRGYSTMREDLFFAISAFPFHRNLKAFRNPPQNNVEMRNRIAIQLLIPAKHGKRTRQNSNDLCEWITHFHGWDCGDKLDRIYAFIGLVENCTIIPKYQLQMDWQSVYTEITYEIILQRGNLDFICLGRGSKRDSELPSWVPDLSIPYGTNPAIPPLECGGQAAYQASCNSSFIGTRQFNWLQLSGVSVAKIKEMTDPHDEGERGIRDSMRLAYGFAKGGRLRPYPHNPSHTYEVALARTLSWDLNQDGNRCRPGESFTERDENSPLPDDFRPDLNEEYRRGTFEAALEVAATRLRKLRRFAVLHDGYIAMVPPNAEKDDDICIFAGASVPMVVRRQESGGYKFIGDCYVHGIMSGELWRKTRAASHIPITLT